MSIRSNVADTALRAQTQSSRSTIRDIDDDHLMQEIKTADVYNSEVVTGFERPQPLGFTCVAMPQDQDKNQQQQGQQGQQNSGGGNGAPNWNKNQPKGPSSEGVVSYGNGSRSHPVMTSLDDRRVRPYGQKPGEGQFYDPAGSGQTIYHRNRGDSDDGLHILTCDDQQQVGELGLEYRDGQGGAKSRYVSIKHVNKKRQRRSLQKTQQREDGSGGGEELPDGSKSGYKHEGDSVNVETRHDAQKISYYDGKTQVGNYKKQGKEWCHHTGDRQQSTRADQNHSHIKYAGAHCWMAGGCFHSVPWVLKPDPCT